MIQIPAYKTLRFKLFVFISLLLVLAIAVSSGLNTRTFHDMLMMRIQEKSLQSARTAANGVAAVIEAWSGQLVMLTAGVSGMEQGKYETLVRNLTASNADFLTLEILTVDESGEVKTLVKAETDRKNDERLLGRDQRKVAEALGDAYRRMLSKTARKKKVNLVVESLARDAKLPILMLAQPFPVKGSKLRAWGVLTVWQTKLFAALAAGSTDSVRVFDRAGKLLTASDVGKIMAPQKGGKSPFPSAFNATSASHGFRQWESKGSVVLGAYARVPGFDLVAVSESDGAPAYEAVRQVMVRTALWAALLVLLAVFFSFVAASGTTSNLRRLLFTTLEIASGRFQSKVVIKSQDEVGVLGAAVNHMGAQIDALMRERVEKARLESEMRTAKMVQDQFFPSRDVGDRNLRIVSFYQPASECGGDWWGYYPLSSRLHLLCIGDATGHGVPAALVTAMVFATASVLARSVTESGEVAYTPSMFLTEFNRTLYESGKGQHTMTFFVGLLNLDTGKLTYANASHNFPMLIRPSEVDAEGKRKWNRSQRKELSHVGAPLGFDPTSTYQDQVIEVNPGDRLVLYTDGLFECTNADKKQWGKRKFMKQVEATHDAPDLESAKALIVKAAFEHFNGYPADDDITLVMAEVSPHWQTGQGTNPAGRPLSASSSPTLSNPRLKLPSVG